MPRFALVFVLTMEAFGKVHPSHRGYHQWLQMEERERELHRADMADLYIATAERFEHSAIFLRPNPDTVEETLRMVELTREWSGNRYFLSSTSNWIYTGMPLARYELLLDVWRKEGNHL